MKVLIYDNKAKDEKIGGGKLLIKTLEDSGVKYEFITGSDLNKKFDADAVFIIGGDGTVLGLTEFLQRNSMPILGINAGKIGYLSEFEKDEIPFAVKSLISGTLKRDERLTVSASIGDKKYYALNDIVVQRIYRDDADGIITNVAVNIDGSEIDKIRGDGVIVSTPTGSTAYSLSAGGAILAPKINALSMTPINAHSLHHRPIIYSADNICEISVVGGADCGLFIDGKFVLKLCVGDRIKVEKAVKPTVFLRKEDSNFFKRLIEKLNAGRETSYE